jgi:6-phosphofructokinase 2
MKVQPKIITITLNPCIDKSARVSELIPEKKLYCSATKLEPGGGGINVARAIKKLGGKATAIYPAGGYTGEFLKQLLEKEEIPGIDIRIAQETRENFIILEESTNRQYRLGMPGPVLEEDEWQQILSHLEAIEDPAYIVASGSISPGMPADIFARIGRIAKAKGAKFIVDTSGEPLQLAVKEGVFMIKPNLSELAKLAGKPELTSDEAVEVAHDLVNKKNCEIVVVSLGAKGALLVTADYTQWFKPPPTKIKSTVGAGDSMVGGLVLSLARGNDIKQATAFGVACGTAATMNPGTELCKAKDVSELHHFVSSWVKPQLNFQIV